MPDPVAESTSRCDDDVALPLLLLLVEFVLVLKSESIRGIIARWTGVGLTNPNLRHVDTSGGHNPRLAKVVVVVAALVIVEEKEGGILVLTR